MSEPFTIGIRVVLWNDWCDLGLPKVSQFPTMDTAFSFVRSIKPESQLEYQINRTNSEIMVFESGPLKASIRVEINGDSSPQPEEAQQPTK